VTQSRLKPAPQLPEGLLRVSQYPTPYSPPPLGYAQQAYWDPTRDVLAPARRASVFMFVYGGIFLLCGGCNLLSAGLMTSPGMVQRMREMFPEMTLPRPGEVATEAVSTLVAATVMIALGAWVRNGRRGAIIASIAAVAFIVLQRTGLGLYKLVSGQEPAAVVGFCVCNAAVFLAPLVLLLVWLIQALRNSGQIDGARAYAQQYWQYAQQYQQGYPQPGYGQGAPPYPQGGEMIPAPPPPPPPSAPPGDPPS
jgi:hypothetical protein